MSNNGLRVDEFAAYQQHAGKATELLAKSRVRVGSDGTVSSDERDRLAAAAAVNAQLAIAAAVAEVAYQMRRVYDAVRED